MVFRIGFLYTVLTMSTGLLDQDQKNFVRTNKLFSFYLEPFKDKFKNLIWGLYICFWPLEFMMKSFATILIKWCYFYWIKMYNWHQNDSTELSLSYIYVVIRLFTLVILFSIEHFLKQGWYVNISIV